MVKEMFERDVEKKPLTLTSADYAGILRPGSPTRSVWGQLCIMGIFTFLMWMVLFSLGGFFLPQAFVNVSQCEPPMQYNQTVMNLTIEQTGIFVTNILAADISNPTLAISLTAEEPEEVEPALSGPVTVDEDESEDLEQSGEMIPAQMIIDAENAADALIIALAEYDPNAIPSSAEKYYISDSEELLNWFEALQECMLNEMMLVSLESPEKHEELQTLLVESGSPDADFWTSGTNLWTSVRDEYFWASTGEALTFMRWLKKPQDPENQNCIQITPSLDSTEDEYSYRWNDNGCHIRSRFICERF